MNDSLKKPLKQQLRKQLKQIQLNSSQLSALEKRIENTDQTTGWQEVNRRWYLLTVASAAIFAVLAVFFISQIHEDNAGNLAQQIAEEVASNHLKLKPLEVKAGSINAVRGYFTKLDFVPIESQLPVLDNLQLMGGRYCSLQGITAAQLRMKQGRNVQTLYQTEYIPEIFGDLPHIEKGEQPIVVYAKGIKVEIWVEKGLLLAVTDASEINVTEEKRQ